MYPWKSLPPLFKVRYLGGGFKYFLFSPLFGEMIQFDEHIFQMGWNHQVGIVCLFWMSINPYYPNSCFINHQWVLAGQGLSRRRGYQPYIGGCHFPCNNGKLFYPWESLDPPIEGFDSVLRRVLGSPNHQFWDPMILRDSNFYDPGTCELKTLVFPVLNGRTQVYTFEFTKIFTS